MGSGVHQRGSRVRFPISWLHGFQIQNDTLPMVGSDPKVVSGLCVNGATHASLGQRPRFPGDEKQEG